MNRKEIAEIRKLLCMQKNQFTLSTDVMLILRKISYLNSSIRPYPFQRMNFSNIWTSSEKLFPERRKKI